MNSIKRFAIVIGCLLAVLAILAYVGVKFAEKPISWMPTALLIVILFLTMGITWAFHPYFLKIKSNGKRYASEGITVVIAVMIIAYVSYVIFGNLWLLFGGSL